MPALGSMIEFTPLTVIPSADFNTNFSAIHTWATNYVVMTDVAKTISAAHTFSHASGLLTDTITERTSAAGVTIDGVLLKDGGAVLTGTLMVGDTANAQNTAGVTINQGSNDDEILSFKSSDIAHGYTSLTETDTWAKFEKTEPLLGGLDVNGFTESTTIVGLRLLGWGGIADTLRNMNARGFVEIWGLRASGSTVAAAGANANLCVWRTYDGADYRTRALVDAEGDFHMDATSNINAWDDHDDVALIAGLRGSLLPRERAAQLGLSRFVEGARPVLESTGVVTYNEDGHHFLSMKGGLFLAYDAIRQVHGRAQERADRLERALLAALDNDHEGARALLAA